MRKIESSFQCKEFFIFLSPLLLFLGFFILLPVLGTFLTSLFQEISFLERKFVLWDNYRNLIQDVSFWHSLRSSFLFILVSVPLELLLGLIFALLLNPPSPLRRIFMALVLIPWAIPSVVSARIWQLIYNYSYGLANFVFLKLGIVSQPLNWLGTARGAFLGVVIADVWKTTPFVTIILLAGLQAVPNEIYAQARMDRANFFQIFARITLPLLRPALVVALLFRTIDALRIFDLIYVLTAGGPGGATTFLSFYAYKYFSSGDFGYGSALSIFLFLVAFLISLTYIRFARYTESVL